MQAFHFYKGEPMEPVQWSEKLSVGVEELDQQHQEIIKMLNHLISTSETVDTDSETISDILLEMTRYAQKHFKTEEKLMKAYNYPGLEEQKKEHRAYRIKTVDFSTAVTLRVEAVPEILLAYLFDWWIHHILDEDMKYKPFFAEKGVR
jgi:hemerythrin-like metal-binding protein